MRAIDIRNIRCFRSSGTVRLAPLTLLVGENSTGKTTFLACLRLAWNACLGDKSGPDFNEEPFFLGAFDQIVHHRGGKDGRENDFQLGITCGQSGETELKISATFRRDGAQPVIVQQRLSVGDVEICATRSKATNEERMVDLDIRVGGEEAQTLVRQERDADTEGKLVDWDHLIWKLKQPDEDREISPSMAERFDDVWSQLIGIRRWYETRPFAFAPVRTSPLRTYEPISATPTPEGTHTPILMQQSYFRYREKWDKAKRFLESFGASAGLFKNIKIRPLGRGKNESDPFQVQLGLPGGGPFRNVIDVGYGVSQVLPLAVAALLKTTTRTFLFQQPEVHLHPRAQAELSTLFRNLIKLHVLDTNGLALAPLQLIVETHSDHLIRRVRNDVRRGKWDTDDVSILFFEKKGLESHIHEIRVDGDGNLQNAPSSYGQFFLEEEQRLFDI